MTEKKKKSPTKKLTVKNKITRPKRVNKKSTVNVVIKTNVGDIYLELYPDKAPVTVKNFLSYVKDGYYKGLIFHRVIKGFMIQGGGLTSDMEERTTKPPIIIESENGLKNNRGTIAMARTSDPDSATSQFFINLADNDFLNYQSPTPRGWGYTVFGKVTDGMDIVDKIADTPTDTFEYYSDVPQHLIQIEDITAP